MRVILIIILILFNLFSVLLIQYDRYDLAHKLYESGIGNISKFICLIDFQSNFNYDMTNDEGTATGYGLFQFYSPYWCEKGRKGGGCMIECEKFIDYDITDDIECAKKVLKIQGITAWDGAIDCFNDPKNLIPDWVWSVGEAGDTKHCPPKRNHGSSFDDDDDESFK